MASIMLRPQRPQPANQDDATSKCFDRDRPQLRPKQIARIDQIQKGIVCRTHRPDTTTTQILKIISWPEKDGKGRLFFRAIIVEAHSIEYPPEMCEEDVFYCADFGLIANPLYGWHKFNWLEFLSH